MATWKITTAMVLASVMAAGPAFAQATTGGAPASGGETKGEQPKGTPPRADSAGQPPRPGASDTSTSGATKSGTGRSDSGMMKSGPSASDRQMRSGMSRGHKGGSAMRDGAGMGQEKVKAAQQALKDKGHDPGDVDGKMGPRTQQALRDFQKTQDIQATGHLDDRTMQSLGVEVGRTSSAGESPAGGSASPGSSASGAGAASPSSSGAAGESTK